LKHEGHSAASTNALARQAKAAARRRGGTLRRAAQKAVHTKGTVKRSAAAPKAARTRARHHR